MLPFLIYEGKVAVSLLAFYLFYRFLLKKETFHRFNRVVLVGTAALSFGLPLCVITLHRPMPSAPFETGPVTASDPALASVAPEALSAPWWQTALVVLFFAGAAFVLIRIVVSVFSILRIVRQGEAVRAEDGCKVIVTERDIDPFSWMRYLVLSRPDWEGSHGPILAHEKAHIAFGHSVELLLVDFLSAFQWFNPAIWMLRSDLQELHEYEADDAVLRGGTNLKEYQYLLIRKAVSKSGYSVANSFNHSILKNRITMMSKSKSPLSRGLRALYLLPLVCLAIGLQARTVYDRTDQAKEKGEQTQQGKAVSAFTMEEQNVNTPIRVRTDGTDPLFIVRQAWGEEKEITRAEFNKLNASRIESVDVLKDGAAKAKYGDKAAHGVVVITLKKPQELEGIVVIRYGKKSDEPVPFYLVEPETMPKFQGGDMNDFSRWLNQRITVPEGCTHAGTMKVGFVVDTDGSVKDVQILESVCDELNAMMLSLIAQSPKWEPATTGGQPVAQFLTIPIVFQLR